MTNLKRTTLVLLLAALTAACGTTQLVRKAQKASLIGDWETAVVHYKEAVQEKPNRADYKVYLERAMIEAARLRLESARDLEAKGELESAIVEYRKVLEYNPASREALARASELEKSVREKLEATRPKPAIAQMREEARLRARQEVILNPASRDPLDLRFNQASTKDILDFVGSATGINITYERDFQPRPFSIQLSGVPLEDALNQIMSSNQLWYKVINDRTILVIPDNTQKRQLYEDQVIRTFYVSHSDPQELFQLIQQITRVPGIAVQPTVAVNKTNNTITVRATRGMAEIIERIIDANDRPRAEVIVDVQILEVSRTRAKQYGLNLGDYQVGLIFSPEQRPATGDDAVNPPFNLNTISQGISTADFYMTVPNAIVRFLQTDSNTRQLAKPQLRGTEGSKLTLNLGDEIPVPSTVFTPIATGGAAANPLTSFSYRPVGVNIEMTPRVSYDGDIVLEISIESSNLGDPINVAGQSLPSFGSRKVTTKLRLREGESNLLAGLVSERDRRILRGIPGVLNLPFFKQVLSDNDNNLQEVDIVMILTPRIVRSHELRGTDLLPINIGTQQNIGLTTAPSLFGVPPEPEGAVPDVPPPGAPGPTPGSVPPPGVPGPPAAAAPGVPGAPATTLPPGVRLPDGTTGQPVTQPPPGTSPVPGTTTAPPPTTQAPPPVPETPVPPTTPVQPPPPPPAPQPSTELGGTTPAQIVLTSPGGELRVGGGPYTVPISIGNVSRASIVSLSITFNPAVLRVRSVQEGSFLRQAGVAVTFTQQVDQASGRIDISMTRTGDTTGASGAGLLAAILFDAIAPGASTLAPSGVATNPQGASIPLTFAPITVTVK